jgi:hypothetical protein
MRRAPIGLIALILCSATGFAAATVLGAGSDPVGRQGGTLAQDLAGAPGSESLDATYPDPAQKRKDWGVVVFTARDGQTCAAAGRTAAGKVGTLRPDGSVEPYPIEDGASCVDLKVVPAGAQVTMGTGVDARTIIHGIAGPEVTSVTLKTPSGIRDLPIGPRGSFLAVLTANTRFDEVEVTAQLRTGEVRKLLG